MYFLYLGGLMFPVMPSKISKKINGLNSTITLINGGEVNIIKGSALTEITIDELLLPTLQKYSFATYPKSFQSAKKYLEHLETWKKKKNPITYKVSRSEPNFYSGTRKKSKYLWDDVMKVTLENYEVIEDAEQYGTDIAVKLSLKEYRAWGAKKVVVRNKKAKSTRARASKSKVKTYVVKSGDTLKSIAKKQLNDSSKWKSIYTKNKKVIDSAVKKHKDKNKYKLFKGTKLKLY